MQLSIDRVVAAAAGIDRPFIRTPQYRSDALSHLLDVEVVLKVETVNPVGSVVGRSADWWFRNRPLPHRLVCAPVDDFGVAMAGAGRARGVDVEVFGPLDADPAKVDALRHAGTTVHLEGRDPDHAIEEARRYASITDADFVEDGRDIELVEGAATVAAELEHLSPPPDAVFVPLGSGTLALGVGQWFHARSPRVRIVGVGAHGAPAMVRSVRERRLVTTDTVTTVAASLAVRRPFASIIPTLADAVDDTVSVDDEQIRAAVGALARHEGLRVSPGGAAALAAVAASAPALRGRRVVVLVTSRAIG